MHIDPAIVASIIAAFALIITTYGHRHTRRDLAQIHVLVNARLTEALDRVEDLEARVEELGGEVAPPQRDRLPAEHPRRAN